MSQENKRDLNARKCEGKHSFLTALRIFIVPAAPVYLQHPKSSTKHTVYTDGSRSCSCLESRWVFHGSFIIFYFNIVFQFLMRKFMRMQK